MPFVTEELRLEMQDLQRRAQECCSESGFVKNGMKYEYNRLVGKIRDLFSAINYLDDVRGA